MAVEPSILSSWMANDKSYTKIAIQYEIKELESRLFSKLDAQSFQDSDKLVVAKILDSIISLYYRYVSLDTEEKHLETQVENDAIEALTPQELQEKIKGLIGEWSNTSLLISCYRAYRDKYSYIHTKSQSQDEPLLLIPLLEAKDSEEWLRQMVLIANEHQTNINGFFSSLSTMPSMSLQQIATKMSQPSYIHLINMLFYYKLNPSQLFTEKTSDEVVVKAQITLAKIHYFIERFHQTILWLVTQLGTDSETDYLFHGDELPKGISLSVQKDYRQFFQTLLTVWQSSASQVTYWVGMQVQEIFKSYKFWFNPSRLIDAIMELTQNERAEQDLLSAITAQFKSLSTSQCLDLYGFFTNKDTHYLWKTLNVASGPVEFGWIVLTQEEKESLTYVKSVLETVMKALLHALLARGIQAQDYDWSIGENPLSPGRRIRQAITRILSLYAIQSSHENKKLERLFAMLETKTGAI